MTVRLPVRVGIGVAALAVIAAALFLFIRPFRPSPSVRLPPYAQIDAAIAGGYVATAGELLSAVPVLPSSENDLLRLLKRAYQVCTETGDYTLLADMAGRALALQGRSARIRAIAGYGAMRASRLADAERALSRGALPPGTGDILRGEAALRRGRAWPGADALTRDLVALTGTEDAAAYARAALRAGDQRLTLDAALLDMKQGALMQARLLVLGSLGESRFDEASGFMLYDAGDFANALRRLSNLQASQPQSASFALCLADISMAGGNAADAESWLLKALPLGPSASWTAYADLALFDLQRGALPAAARRINDGLAFFPRSRELRFQQAQIAVAMGQKDQAESIVRALAAENPADADAGLLLLALRAPSLSPESYRGELWTLFNHAPASRAVFGALSAALFATHDWEGAELALHQFEAAQGEPAADTLLVAGMVSAQKGDPAAAIAALRKSMLLARDPRALYDLGLVYLSQGNARAARAELDAAAEEYPPPGEAPDARAAMARIETFRGTAHLLDGDLTAARTALEHARMLDPRNLRAALELRKLEAGRQ